VSEPKTLLSNFDSPQLVEVACRETFGQSRHFAVPAMIKGAVKDGLLEVRDTDGEVVDSPKIYCREMILTDAGRDFCGLKRLEKVPVKAKAKTLFD